MHRRTPNSGAKRRPTRADKVGIDRDALEVFGSAAGSVALGWIGPGVFYARFVGSLSMEVGTYQVARLRAALAETESIRYFADSSALESYDLLARSGFARLVVENRAKFESIVILTWPQGITPSTLTFAAAIGDPVDILADAADFEARLLRSAPLAKQKLDPRTWIQTPVVPGSSR